MNGAAVALAAEPSPRREPRHEQVRQEPRREQVRQEPRHEQPRHETIREDQRREAQRLEEVIRAEEAKQEVQPLPLPVQEPAMREEPPVRREEPKIDPKALLESSGLVMIETDHSKTQFSVPVEEPQQLGRPRRERAKPASQEEDLQQVETRK